MQKASLFAKINDMKGEKVTYLTDNFISIGGCCLGLYILGKDRIRGPIDNILIFSYKVVRFLIEDTYIKYLTNTSYVKVKKTQPKKNEPPVNFLFKTKLKIIHNNFEDKQYLQEISKRMNNFKVFLNKLKKEKNKYMVFSIPYTFTKKGKEIDSRLERLIKYLKDVKLLDKTIFVGCHKSKYITKVVWWDNYLDNQTFKKLYTKYKIKYIELNDLDLSNQAGKENAFVVFKSKIENQEFKRI